MIGTIILIDVSMSLQMISSRVPKYSHANNHSTAYPDGFEGWEFFGVWFRYGDGGAKQFGMILETTAMQMLWGWETVGHPGICAVYFFEVVSCHDP